MYQLVLPIDEFFAHSMELALYPYIPGLDWGGAEWMDYGIFRRRLSEKLYGRSFYDEVLGEWDDKEELFFSKYQVERLRALRSTKPWTQLLLPLGSHHANPIAQNEADTRDIMRAWVRRFAAAHGSVSGLRPGVRPLDGLLTFAETELLGLGDRSSNGLFP